MPRPIRFRLPIAVSMLICCSACADDPLRRLAGAERDRRPAAALPDWPDECRAPEAPSIRAGERLDLVVLRLAAERAALAGRLDGCAGWYEALRRGR